MTLKQAYRILKHHAEWRKGAVSEKVNPDDLTKALEVIITYLDNKINNSSHATI
jgi:hypothetical protein